MKRFRIVQILVLLLVAGDLSAMWATTDVYEDIQERIVKVLCLSCIKLRPRTEVNFTFDTVGGVDHPEFVLENLSKGLVFLHFSEDVCAACEVMLPVINQFFGVSFEKTDPFTETIDFMGATVTIIYINIDHRPKYLNDAFYIYDKENIGGLPMFTVISLGYDRGIVKPYYATLYGKFALDTNEERFELITDVFSDAIDIYQQNIEGYTYP
jgi:hypothetical protein